MFSWGGASNGELGQGGLEEHIVSSPTRVPFPPASSLASVAAGGRHTLLLTQRGELHSCGSNDLGQLGREGSQTRSVVRLWLVETALLLPAGSSRCPDWPSTQW